MAAVRRTAILFLLAALLGGVVWLVTQKGPAIHKPSLPLLLGPAIRQSRSLAVTFQGTSRAYREQGGGWRGPAGAVAGASIRGYLFLLSRIRPQTVIGRYGGEPTGYGLHHPLFGLQAVLADGRPVNLRVGRSIPGQGGYYAQVDRTGPVVVLGISDVDSLTFFAVNGP